MLLILELKTAAGQWVAFLNADDYYVNQQVLSTVGKILNKSDSDVVYGKVQFIKRNLACEPLGLPFGDDWWWGTFSRRSTIPHPASFTCRNFIEGVRKFDEKFSNALDYELYLRKGDALQALYIPFFAYMRVGGMEKWNGYDV